MITLRQVDSVVQASLFVIKGWEHERQEQGTTILYNVWSNETSPKLNLGVFRVYEWIDGSGRCGWQPLPETSPYQDKLRRKFYMDMIMPILIKANTPADLDAPRPVEVVKDDGEAAKVKKPNLQTIERAMIWRNLSPYIKNLKVRPTAKECIAKIKEHPTYSKKIISRQRMETILSEGISGAYDEILKSL